MVTAVQVQTRRDSAANIASFAGAQGELVYDTTNNRVVGNDGSRAGGYPHALAANLPFGSFKNLIAGNVAGPQSFAAPTTPNYQIKIAADFVSVYNATLGVSALLSSVSATADVTTTGANGLDTGAVAASTWYSVWVIYNPATATTAALLSLSASSPTMPSGHTYKFFVGWWRTDASSHFLRILCQGRKQQYVVGTNPTGMINVIGGANGNETIPTWTAASIASIVPTTAGTILLCLQMQGASFAAIVAPNNSYGAYSSTTNAPPLMGAGDGTFRISTVWLMLEGANVYYATRAASVALFCLGWENNNI